MEEEKETQSEQDWPTLHEWSEKWKRCYDMFKRSRKKVLHEMSLLNKLVLTASLVQTMYGPILWNLWYRVGYGSAPAETAFAPVHVWLGGCGRWVGTNMSCFTFLKSNTWGGFLQSHSAGELLSSSPASARGLRQHNTQLTSCDSIAAAPTHL